MPNFRSFFSPKAYKYKAKHLAEDFIKRWIPDYRGVLFAPPGHFYSPLLKISEIEENGVPGFDGKGYWENIDLRIDAQKALFQNLVPIYRKLSFPEVKSASHHYFSQNHFFSCSDACLLSSMIETRTPKKIIEIGSGFSSAVIIDTIERLGISPQLQFIEPYPERLKLLLDEGELEGKIFEDIVQKFQLEAYDSLESGDILFVDSSHIGKIGSDVTHIFLKILPRLKKGVLVHFHDIFYPESYPIEWLVEGRAWNESILLRCFLLNNRDFSILAFNSFAWSEFPDLFLEGGIDFRKNTGCSIWIEKTN